MVACGAASYTKLPRPTAPPKPPSAAQQESEGLKAKLADLETALAEACDKALGAKVDRVCALRDARKQREALRAKCKVAKEEAANFQKAATSLEVLLQSSYEK